jgi:NADH-quinone oxidoreductase subunit M
VDGTSLLLLLLTFVLGIAAVLASWSAVPERAGLFYGNLLAILAGVIGVFMAVDLLLFYLFWELMLVPMYFLIVIFGHEKRVPAGMKFFLFTQASGLLMLLAILGLVFAHRAPTGVLTFDARELLETPMMPELELPLMLGFFIAFAVKLPALGVHTWLPDAHTEAPTAGSVVLAGLMLKTGAYGLLRFVVPLFPGASHAMAPVAMAIGIAGILYGAVLAFDQTDMKRLVAYTSVSHMGFVLLGIFAWNEIALEGSVIEMLSHGLATGALFIVVGLIQDRVHTRDAREMGGFWATSPKLGSLALFFAAATLGLPGLGSFVGEYMILQGALRVHPLYAVLASPGLILSVIYSLRFFHRIFQGRSVAKKPKDLGARELALLGGLAVLLLGLGLYPELVLRTVGPSIERLEASAPALAQRGAP